jgi:hypothetical protein
MVEMKMPPDIIFFTPLHYRKVRPNQIIFSYNLASIWRLTGTFFREKVGFELGLKGQESIPC